MTQILTMEVEVARLTVLLRRQLDRYERLRALSREQSRLVETGDAHELLGVLSQRQVLVDELGSIDRELAPYRQRWERLAAEFDPSMRGQVGDLLEKVREHLAAILEQDDRDRATLETVKSGVSQGLDRARQVGAAMSAYGQSGGGGAGASTNRRA